MDFQHLFDKVPYKCLAARTQGHVVAHVLDLGHGVGGGYGQSGHPQHRDVGHVVPGEGYFLRLEAVSGAEIQKVGHLVPGFLVDVLFLDAQAFETMYDALGHASGDDGHRISFHGAHSQGKSVLGVEGPQQVSVWCGDDGAVGQHSVHIEGEGADAVQLDFIVVVGHGLSVFRVIFFQNLVGQEAVYLFLFGEPHLLQDFQMLVYRLHIPSAGGACEGGGGGMQECVAHGLDGGGNQQGVVMLDNGEGQAEEVVDEIGGEYRSHMHPKPLFGRIKIVFSAQVIGYPVQDRPQFSGGRLQKEGDVAELHVLVAAERHQGIHHSAGAAQIREGLQDGEGSGSGCMDHCRERIVHEGRECLRYVRHYLRDGVVRHGDDQQGCRPEVLYARRSLSARAIGPEGLDQAVAAFGGTAVDSTDIVPLLLHGQSEAEGYVAGAEESCVGLHRLGLGGVVGVESEGDGVLGQTRGAEGDLSVLALVLADIVPEGEEQSLGVFRSHDDAADYLGFGVSGQDAGEVKYEFTVGVCDEGEVGVVAGGGLLGDFYAEFFLLGLIVHILSNYVVKRPANLHKSSYICGLI